jgi:hypothetical protein
VFILDADEAMEDGLKNEVQKIVCADNGSKDGYWCRFKLMFMGRWIRRASMYPSWSLRLFRHNLVRYERRDVNSHPLVRPGREGYLIGHLINEDRRGFSQYQKRLDEFSTLEAHAISQESLLSGRLFGTRAERRRYLKNLFIRLPFRPLILFIYLYILRLGMLEGRRGFDYCLLRAVLEWLITVKLLEGRRNDLRASVSGLG